MPVPVPAAARGGRVHGAAGDGAVDGCLRTRRGSRRLRGLDGAHQLLLRGRGAMHEAVVAGDEQVVGMGGRPVVRNGCPRKLLPVAGIGGAGRREMLLIDAPGQRGAADEGDHHRVGLDGDASHRRNPIRRPARSRRSFRCSWAGPPWWLPLAAARVSRWAGRSRSRRAALTAVPVHLGDARRVPRCQLLDQPVSRSIEHPQAGWRWRAWPRRWRPPARDRAWPMPGHRSEARSRLRLRRW